MLKFKVEMEVVVPEGEFCENYETNEFCSHLEFPEHLDYAICNLFNQKLTEMMDEVPFKCNECSRKSGNV